MSFETNWCKVLSFFHSFSSFFLSYFLSFPFFHFFLFFLSFFLLRALSWIQSITSKDISSHWQLYYQSHTSIQSFTIQDTTSHRPRTPSVIHQDINSHSPGFHRQNDMIPIVTRFLSPFTHYDTRGPRQDITSYFLRYHQLLTLITPVTRQFLTSHPDGHSFLLSVLTSSWLFLKCLLLAVVIYFLVQSQCFPPVSGHHALHWRLSLRSSRSLVVTRSPACSQHFFPSRRSVCVPQSQVSSHTPLYSH